MKSSQTFSNNKDLGKPALYSDQKVTAAPPAYHTKTSSPFALISFHTLDRIRFTQLPESDVGRLHECVRRNWELGVSDKKPYDASIELKLKSCPWGSSHAGSPKVFRLVQAILAETYELGWTVEQGVILCKKSSQKDTLLLRRTPQPIGLASWLSISFDQNHIVSVHGGPLEFRQCLIARFSGQGWSAESAYIEDRMEIRLKKSYWMPQGADTVKARLMLLEIAEALDLFDYRIYASLKLSVENDCLFCIKDTQDASV